MDQMFAARISPGKIRVRKASADCARLSDPILDYMVYWCNIRGAYSFSLLDRMGHYWSAPHWYNNGMVFEFKHGVGGMGTRVNRAHEDPRAQGVLSDLAQVAWDLKEALNGRPEENSALNEDYGYLVSPMEDAPIDEYNRPGVKYLVIDPSVIINAEEDAPSYCKAMEEWSEMFEAHYPRPQGSIIGSHAITEKVAKFKHRKKIINWERKVRRSAETHTSLTAKIDSIHG